MLHRQNSFKVQPKILDAKTKPIPQWQMHVHDCALLWCNASTSIQSDEAKLVLLAKPPLSVKCVNQSVPDM
jgi:hypothetical protein